MSVYRGSWAELLARVDSGRGRRRDVGGEARRGGADSARGYSAARGSAPTDRVPAASAGMTVYVVGGTDTGKTTLSHQLLGAVGREDAWYIDCDPGQSVLGPPTTVGLARFQGGGTPGGGDDTAGGVAGGSGGTPDGRGGGDTGAARFELVALSFVGSTSPAHHLLQTVAGTARLVREVPASGLLVCDSSGFVSGRLGGEFQYNLVSLVRPDIVVAIDADAELRRTLGPFHEASDIEVWYMDSDTACRSKSRAARADHRRQLFTRYFAGATQQRVDLSQRSLHGVVPVARGTAGAPAPGTTAATAPTTAAPAYRNRLCALLDGRQFVVVLAIILGVNDARRASAGAGADAGGGSPHIADGATAPAGGDRAIEELEVLAPPFDGDRIASVQLGSHKLFPEDLTYQERPEQTSGRRSAPPETDKA